MALFAITPTQVKTIGKWLIREAGVALPFALDALTSGFTDRPGAATPLEWRRFVWRYSRTTPTGTVEDLAQWKLDLLNVTAGDVDPTWTSGDYTASAGPMSAFNSTLQPLLSDELRLVDIRAYRMRFNPVPDLERPFADSGPPEFVNVAGTAMTGSSTLPYQVAATVTLKTELPRHWGRCYLPTPAGTSVDATGSRWTSAWRTSVAAGMRTMLNAEVDAGFWPVIPMGQFHKTPLHLLMGVTQIQVDDIPDVQRRRRPKQAAARTLA